MCVMVNHLVSLGYSLPNYKIGQCGRGVGGMVSQIHDSFLSSTNVSCLAPGNAAKMIYKVLNLISSSANILCN